MIEPVSVCYCGVIFFTRTENFCFKNTDLLIDNAFIFSVVLLFSSLASNW